MRRALSLVELVMALAVVGVSVVSIYQGLGAGRRQAQRLDITTTAHFLAIAIMEQATEAFATRDARFFKLFTPPVDVVVASARGDWKAPYLALGVSRRRVMAPAPNPYFDAAHGPVLPRGIDPDEARYWDAFSYEVRAGFTTQVERDGPPLALDSDGDGQAENDLGQLEVEVFYMPPDGSGPLRSVARLVTLLASPDRAAGASALEP